MKTEGSLLVAGEATGKLVYSDTPLSFWGGIDVKTGIVIDRHHPLCGVSLRNVVFAVPGGRGSCTGSSAILELLMNDCAPAALVFTRPEPILTLGVLVANALFERSIPVVVLHTSTFSELKNKDSVVITASSLQTNDGSVRSSLSPFPSADVAMFQLDTKDQEILDGKMGEAARLSMQIIVLFAQMQGAKSLISVTQAHIDACVYVGKTTLSVPKRLLEMGAKVVVPTTLNSLSVDMRRFKELGTDTETSKAAAEVGEVYLQIGAKVSFTCAPYLLQTAPSAGENIGWAESNAVVFANSVLGARTQKYPDYLDVFIALTGRAPNAGCHTDEGRKPTVCIDVYKPKTWDDSFFPLVGYCVGERVDAEIPFVTGLEDTNPQIPDLKAFGAGFATTSAAPMFHIRNVTCEALKMGKLQKGLDTIEVTMRDLRDCWRRLNTNTDPSVSLVSLGNPHFAFEEMEALSDLVKGRSKHPKTSVVVTTSREVYERAARAGYIDIIEAFGASFITDTCWCMIDEPVIPIHGKNLMTNSSKYAHYGPGTTKRGVHFGSLRSCVDSAEAGMCASELPEWLTEP